MLPEGEIRVPIKPIANPSDSAEVKACLQEVIAFIGDRDKLYFSSRLAISLALLRIVGQIRAALTPEDVERFIWSRGGWNL